MGLFLLDLMVSFAGIGASELSHRVQTSRRILDYESSCRMGQDMPYEYYLMCYANKYIKEEASKYFHKYYDSGNAVEYKVCEKMAVFDLLGDEPPEIFYPQLLFARRMVWFKGFLPSNMSTAWSNENERRQVENARICPDEHIGRSFVPFPTDHREVKSIYWSDLVAKHNSRRAFNHIYYFYALQTWDDYAKKDCEKRRQQDMEEMHKYRRNRLFNVIDFLHRFTTSDMPKAMENIDKMLAVIEDLEEQEQKAYDDLPEYLKETDRAHTWVENVDYLDAAASILYDTLESEKEDDELLDDIKEVTGLLESVI